MKGLACAAIERLDAFNQAVHGVAVEVGRQLRDAVKSSVLSWHRCEPKSRCAREARAGLAVVDAAPVRRGAGRKAQGCVAAEVCFR